MSIRHIVLPVIFVLLGAARELMFPSASLFATHGLFVSLVIVILFFGGLGLVLSLSGITDEEQAPELLSPKEQPEPTDIITNDALDSVGLMTAGLVHNFRNYLQIMEGTMQMLQKHGEHYTGINRALNIQKKCINQARDTTNQMLWFVNRSEDHSKEQRPINEIVEEALVLAELLLKEKSIEIIRDFEENDCPIPVNEISLMQSVINLIKNSAQASLDRSKIVVSTRFTDHKYSYEFCVVVKDFGIGIRDDHQENLFQPLNSTTPDGTGLGLYTVKQLVENDGGQVEVNSNEGEGTEVRLRYEMLNENSLH